VLPTRFTGETPVDAGESDEPERDPQDDGPDDGQDAAAEEPT
jgi:hypothetical protein